MEIAQMVQVIPYMVKLLQFSFPEKQLWDFEIIKLFGNKTWQAIFGFKSYVW